MGTTYTVTKRLVLVADMTGIVMKNGPILRNGRPIVPHKRAILTDNSVQRPDKYVVEVDTGAFQNNMICVESAMDMSVSSSERCVREDTRWFENEEHTMRRDPRGVFLLRQ